MFSYYGSKSQVAGYYPPPKYSKIIEPFAGSARYSLKHWQNDVLLVDKYDVVINIWKWLQQCSKGDILGLPTLKEGDDIRCLNLNDEAKMFLGMLAGVASTSPRWKVSSYAANQGGRKRQLKTISEHLHKIRHWEVRLGSYDEIENTESTWFIDPPYQFGGNGYKHNKIDFDSLSEWCKSRNGQAIVCENTKADWLPFKPVTKLHGAMSDTIEAIWSNHPTNYDAVQSKLF
jgi:site-specific DNA-adenine methylase